MSSRTPTPTRRKFADYVLDVALFGGAGQALMLMLLTSPPFALCAGWWLGVIVGTFVSFIADTGIQP